MTYQSSATASMTATETAPASARSRHGIRLRSDRWVSMCAAANLQSEAEIAAALGISRQHVWRIHSGERSPGADFIAAVLTAFPAIRFEHIFAPDSRERPHQAAINDDVL